MSDAPSLPKLEASLAEINELLAHMEKGDLTLEQSLTHFERGITLIKHCQKIIEAADHKVQILLQQNGQDVLQSYDELPNQSPDQA